MTAIPKPDTTRCPNYRQPGIEPEGAEQSQKFADKAAGARKANIGQGEDHEASGIDRHAIYQPAIIGDQSRMHAVIDNAHTEEQGG